VTASAQTSREAGPSAAVSLLQMTVGGWITQAIHVAAVLGVADHLAAGGIAIGDLAQRVGAHPGALERLLRALASVGIFAESAPGEWRLTPLAEPLLSDAPGSLRAWATMVGEDWYRATWTQLIESVRSGAPAFDRVHGMRPFQFFAAHPPAEQLFTRAMGSFSASEIAAILAAYDFSAFASIADVGGGHGALMAAILRAHPQPKGLVFDLPGTIPAAQALLRQEGLEDRCGTVAGDFSAEVPGGFDAYVLKHIIHDWNDEAAVRILSNCRRALARHGKVLLIEIVLAPSREAAFGTLLDLEMLLIGGAERTAEQYETLFSLAGLQLSRVIRTDAPVSILEAQAR
jgi:SAM-dependent methyltransferase